VFPTGFLEVVHLGENKLLGAEMNRLLLCPQDESFLWLSRLALDELSDASLSDLFVVGNSLLEIFLAARLPHMLGPDANLLPQNPGSHTLVDNDSQSSRGDIPDYPGPSMVILEWLALLDRGITNDVHVVPNLVHSQVCLLFWPPLAS